MFDSITNLIEQSGAWMYILAPLFMIAVAILPVPAEIPAMLNGMVFGPTVGVLITWGGALIGAAVSFELARRFGRPLGVKVLSPAALDRVDRLAVSAGWPGLLVARLIPTIAFTLLNWGAGLTPIGRWTFLWTTAIGIVPGAIVFTLSGTGLAAFYWDNSELAPAVAVLVILVLVLAVYRYRRASGQRSAVCGGSGLTADR